MISKGWVAKHTGLPSFYLDGPGALTATHDGITRTLAVTGEGETLLSDPGAPAESEVVYRHGESTVTLIRRGFGHCVVTDVSGRGLSVVSQTGDDGRDHDPRVRLMDRGAARDPLVRWELKPLSPTGTLECRTSGSDTWGLRSLAHGGRAPLWVIHDRALCQIEGCDIDEARLIVPLSFQEGRTNRFDVAQRLWKIDYQQLTQPTPTAPVVTWGEWEAFGGGWQNWSELVAAQKIAGM